MRIQTAVPGRVSVVGADGTEVFFMGDVLTGRFMPIGTWHRERGPVITSDQWDDVIYRAVEMLLYYFQEQGVQAWQLVYVSQDELNAAVSKL